MTYWLALLNSDLPFAPWVAVALWAALFVGNHLLARATRTMMAGQAIVAVQNRGDLERGFRPHLVLAQALFGNPDILLLDEHLVPRAGDRGPRKTRRVAVLALHAGGICSTARVDRGSHVLFGH